MVLQELNAFIANQSKDSKLDYDAMKRKLDELRGSND